MTIAIIVIAVAIIATLLIRRKSTERKGSAIVDATAAMKKTRMNSVAAHLGGTEVQTTRMTLLRVRHSTL